ncbi:nuclear factor erythroid 2-related factor 2 isoform X2 [Lissotriton helveticus]
MMSLEHPLVQPTQQEIDLIDILWRQDIDLGARREVFDYCHRQKEYELEKQKKLERERLEALQRDQEKALLAQLQLDEETGEFVPILPPQHIEADTDSISNSSLQNKQPLQQSDGALSFAECMQLLADSFPFVIEEEAPASTFQPLVLDSCPESEPVFITPNQTVTIDPDPIFQDPLTVVEAAMNEVDQVWEELLSIPELQCLNIENDNLANVDIFPIQEAEPPETDENYSFYNPMGLVGKEIVDSDPVFQSNFVGSFTSTMTVEEVTYLKSEPLNPCDEVYTPFMEAEASGSMSTPNSNNLLTEFMNEPVDISDFSLCKAFNGEKSADTPSFNDSDSGISVNESPNRASPGPSSGSSLYGDAPYNYTDSEMEDMDSAPPSVVQNNSEMHPLLIAEDSAYPSSPSQMVKKQLLGAKLKNSPKKEVPASPGPNRSPFTKDKYTSRLEARFTRDSERAKVLQIPFSVDHIINLPVDDFNDLMSKHQLNDAQLALIRDIRRRGKNKVAAQNCRKRKLENIVELEQDLDQLKDEKDKLLAEKGEYSKNFQLLKEQLSVLYIEVFSQLRDEDGNPYSPAEYSLQQTKDGNVFLVPKTRKTENNRD